MFIGIKKQYFIIYPPTTTRSADDSSLPNSLETITLYEPEYSFLHEEIDSLMISPSKKETMSVDSFSIVVFLLKIKNNYIKKKSGASLIWVYLM